MYTINFGHTKKEQWQKIAEMLTNFAIISLRTTSIDH